MRRLGWCYAGAPAGIPRAAATRGINTPNRAFVSQVHFFLEREPANEIRVASGGRSVPGRSLPALECVGDGSSPHHRAHSRLRRYARALVGDRYVADDLVQDTLERAWNKFYLWRPGSDLRAWLFTIMHNVFVNQASAAATRSSRQWTSSRRLRFARPRASSSSCRRGPRVCARLSAEQREVVLLVAVEQLTYEEVSCALDIPIGTVMSRLSRARERMRQLLGGRPWCL